MRQILHRVRRAVAVVFTTIVLTAACGSGRGTDEATAPAPTAAATTAGDTAAGEAPSAEVETTADGAVTGPVFETVAGSTFDLGSIEGTDTLLWFWAPW